MYESISSVLGVLKQSENELFTQAIIKIDSGSNNNLEYQMFRLVFVCPIILTHARCRTKGIYTIEDRPISLIEVDPHHSKWSRCVRANTNSTCGKQSPGNAIRTTSYAFQIYLQAITFSTFQRTYCIQLTLPTTTLPKMDNAT